MGSLEENKALVRRYAEEVFGKGDVDLSDEILADGYVSHNPPPGIAPDKAGREQLAVAHADAFDNLALTAADMIAEGDKVAIRWTWSGTQKAEYLGIPSTGKSVTMTGISIHRIDGGKIVETWDQVDMLGMMQQMGVIPAPQGQ